MSALLLILVFLSGAAGLLYEIVWTRSLVLVLGSTAQAVSSVLAAFLGGLALGAAILGRRADRSMRPLRFCAGLELAIGAWAIAFPAMSWLLERIVLAATAGGAGPTTLGLVRFLGTFLLLLPATFAMGGTVPVLCRFVVRQGASLGRRVGTIYAVNTLGATVGCLLAGFVTIPAIGLRASLALAAALNLGVAAVAFGLSRSTPALPAPEGNDVRRRRFTRREVAVLAAFALSGLTALGYEVLWTRVLVFFVKSVTYGFSFMLATFLLGLVLGSAAATSFVDRRGRALPALVGAVVGAGGTAFLSVWLLVTRTETLRALAPTPGGELGALYGPLAFLIVATILPAGLFYGATFPLAIRLLADEAKGAAGRVGAATAANTGGAILGAYLAGFVLLPSVGVAGSLRLLVLGNGIAALALAFGLGGNRLRSAAAVAAAAIALTAFSSGDFFAQRLGKIREGRLVFLDEGEDVIVTVYEEPSDDGVPTRTLYVNGSSYTGSRFFARRYMKTMGHLPLLLCEKRERALVICLGTGMTLSALARHDLEETACVELSRGVREALPLFSAVNDDVAGNPDVHIRLQDGRHWLLTHDEPWDVITLEPPPPLNAGVGNLYSKEFYELCRDRLAPGGVLCQWFPLHSQTVDEYRMSLATFADVFPDASLWLPVGRNGVGIGVKEGGAPWTFARLKERFADAGVREGLVDIGFPTPESLFSTMLLDAAGIARFVGDAPLVTDDRPRLEFHDLARAGQRFPTGDLLGEMMPLRIDPVVRLGLENRAGDLDAVVYRAAIQATNRFYRGAYLFERQRIPEAAAEWQAALELEPANAYYRSVLGVDGD
jgi:spermidine synthase